MIEISRTVKGHWRSLSHFSFILLIIWTAVFVAPLELSFHYFLILFSLSR
jgi:hypothetical protein